jgi:hypothetical protein
MHEVVLVARPHGVVHFYPGALTRSGAAVPAAARPFCGTRTRRLQVVARTVADVADAVAGRRFCRSCTHRLPARLGAGRDLRLDTREQWVEAYADLTVADLRLAAAWCRTVEETYQVASLLMQVHGPKPIRPKTDDGRELLAAYDAVEDRRHLLTAAAMTDAERAAVAAARETDLFNRRLAEKQRRKSIAVEKAHARQRAGSYLLPHERELVADTA